MELKPEFRQPDEADITAIVEIAKRQAALMDDLQVALEAADDLRALGVARELVGLEKQVKEV
jgi:hypothetical protein